MLPFATVSGPVALFDRADVDTDQIIPARHLKRVDRRGFGRYAFEGWRGTPGFFLDRTERFRFLVAGPNFGCGSSREHAPWALAEIGLRAIVAPSFADIFRANCERIGLLPIVLESEGWSSLARAVAAAEQAPPDLTVDLPAQEITCATAPSHRWRFEIDPHVKASFIGGLDFIEATLAHVDRIERFEARRPAYTARTR